MCNVIAIKTMYHNTCFMNRSIQFPTDMSKTMNEKEVMNQSQVLIKLFIKRNILTCIFYLEDF